MGRGWVGGGGRGGRIVKRKGREGYLGLWAVGSFLSASIHDVLTRELCNEGMEGCWKRWKDYGCSLGRIYTI